MAASASAKKTVEARLAEIAGHHHEERYGSELGAHVRNQAVRRWRGFGAAKRH